MIEVRLIPGYYHHSKPLIFLHYYTHFCETSQPTYTRYCSFENNVPYQRHVCRLSRVEDLDARTITTLRGWKEDHIKGIKRK